MKTRVDIERPALLWYRSGGDPLEYGIWPERPVTIGRESTNTVVIESPFVSKAHAILQYRNGGYVLEDLGSSNGTRVNGQPVDEVELQPGDVIEFGDQRLEFVDRAAAAPAATGLSKGTKLLLAAGGTAVVMIGGLGLLLAAMTPDDPLVETRERRTAAPVATTPTTPLPQIAAPSGIVQEVMARAQRSGVAPADAMFDEALVQFRVGRLRDARELLTAVVATDRSHELAANRLAAVEGLLSQSIARYASEGDRAFSQLRFRDAIAAWEQVLLLAEPADPRYAEAQSGISRATARLPR